MGQNRIDICTHSYWKFFLDLDSITVDAPDLKAIVSVLTFFFKVWYMID